MSIYNSLLFSHHDFDFIMFKIQFPIVQKFNQNIVMGSPPFNLKQAYQTTFVCPHSFLLSRAYPKENII